MAGDKADWLVALDGGTTNTRARLLHHGRVVATVRRSVGVRDVAAERSDARLAEAVRGAVTEVCHQAGGIEPGSLVATGMLSSEVGLHAVPHLQAPAGLEELARAAVEHLRPDVAQQPILFVPGVRTPAAPGADGWTEADIMRGEECETIGAWLARREHGLPVATEFPAAVLIWPGSHTKLVAVDAAGRIVASHTTLAGEMLDVLARHTLLAASLPECWPAEPAAGALEAGARSAHRAGLGRSAFLVRMAHLSGQLNSGERVAFLMGAAIADDVGWLLRHPLLGGKAPVWVGGRQPQRGLYARWLQEACTSPVVALGDELAEAASALGAWAVVRCRAELKASAGSADRLTDH